MDALGRYYTQGNISNLVINSIQQESPENIIDLGVGEGSLLFAAIDRWNSAKYAAVDIDKNSVATIHKKAPFVDINHLNSLRPNLLEKVQISESSIDVAICNPPYVRIDRNHDCVKCFTDVGLHHSQNLSILTSDVIFIAQNLRLLRTGGELAIILPDSIFTGYNFSALREDLLVNHRITRVIELPDKCFSNTEAKTHILALEKFGSPQDSIILEKADENGDIIGSIEVSYKKLIERMDYSYHQWAQDTPYQENSYTLEKLGVEIWRGNHTSKELENSGDNYFHTSHFSNGNRQSFPRKSTTTLRNPRFAKRGDILLARNGKRVIGKGTIIQKGAIPLSDCVYLLRTRNEKLAKALYKYFMSADGQKWFAAHAHGVCSRVISKRDLLKLKVPRLITSKYMD